MADLQKILNKFNQLGIVNEGLSVDAPAVKKKQDFEFEKPKKSCTGFSKILPRSHRQAAVPSLTRPSR